MRFSVTCRLFLLACLLGAVIWFAERRQAGESAFEREPRHVLSVAADRATFLMIERGDMRVECVRKDGVWYVEWPLNARADEGNVMRILSVLEGLKREETITAAQRNARSLDWKDYGLDVPQARFALADRTGRQELLIGDDAPLSEWVYVRLQGSDEVLACSQEIMEVIPQSVVAMRDTTVIHGDAFHTSKIEIERPGAPFIQLMRNGGGWVFHQPLTARADREKVRRLLDLLYSLKVEQFVWDAPVAREGTGEVPVDIEAERSAQVERYRLTPDEAAVRVKVYLGVDDVGKELTFGDPVADRPERVYAKRRSMDAIYAVPKEAVDAFSVGVNEWRDRDLFTLRQEEVRCIGLQEGDIKVVLVRDAGQGWAIQEPVQWKADHMIVDELVEKLLRLRVQTFVEGPRTNLAELGLSPPAHVVHLMAELPPLPGEKPPVSGPEAAVAPSGAEAGPSNKLLLGPWPESDLDPVYARLAVSDTLFTLAAGDVRRLLTVDPLVFRDRTMLAVLPGNIRRLSLTKAGAEQAVVLEEAGRWRAVAPSDGRADPDAVQSILYVVSNMRALRIERRDPKGLAAYGLEPPAAVLTLSLTGEEGIKKSILMGQEAADGGLYAMVQGQDMVFVLDKDVAGQLMADLVRLAAPGPVADERSPVPSP